MSIVKFSDAKGACATCAELSSAGVWGSVLTKNLEFPDDESPDFFLLEGGNVSSAICFKFCIAGVFANLEFAVDASLDVFLRGTSADVFRWRVADFKGTEVAFSGEGVGGSDVCLKLFHLACSGEDGAERVTRGAGKEREASGLSARAKGDMGRTRGRGLSRRGELLPGDVSSWF